MDVIVPKVSLPTQSGQPAQKGGQLIPSVSAPENPQEAYHVFEQRDEAQVVDSLKGRFLEDFVYSFCKRHKTADGQRPPECDCPDVIVGLSWLGIQEAAREYRGIKVPIEKMLKRETDDSVEVICEALDEKTGNSRIGVATQPKKIRLRNGGLMDDEFCVSKAVSKAQRNAIRPLLPVTLIKAWIAAKLKGGAVPPSLETAAPLPNLPAPQPAPQSPPAPAAPQTKSSWRPSAAQVKRVFGLAFGNKVTRKRVQELVLSICGVSDPSLIGSRAGYETLCTAIERGGLPA